MSDSQQQILKKIEEIEASVKKSQNWVNWEDKATASGIEIAGGPTTITRTGRIVSTGPVQNGPASYMILAVVKAEDGKIYLVDITLLRFID